MKVVPSSTFVQLDKMQKQIIWKSGTPKLEHNTLCNEYEKEELKNLAISPKITSLQFLGIKRLYNDTFHTWKVKPSFLIKNYKRKMSLFHSNLNIKPKIV